MKQVIECAYCDGKAELHKDGRDLTYRKEIFKVVEHFYKCDTCKEEFTTTETDTVTLLQAHNQYREKHSIPFPEVIIAIRQKYEVSATKMSEVLGLGVNGFSNYENGEIPTPAIGNLILTANRAEVFKTMLERAKESFPTNLYLNTLEKVNFLIEKERVSQPFYTKLNLIQEPSGLTGFKKPNKDKIANALVKFITVCNNEFNDKLKLNKLLFYADFTHYKLFGQSITGLSYRAINYGPVPTCYDNIFSYLESEGIICSNWVNDGHGAAKETFITSLEFNGSLFTEEEKTILDVITDSFKNMPTWDLVDLSHKEQGWIDLHTERKIINYQQYAFNLVGA